MLVYSQKNLWNTYVHPDGRKTTGSMDLGGASTQIAFAVPEDLRGPDYMNVKMYGYSYNVYTHSFLCYGKNELGKKVLEKIVEVTIFSYAVCSLIRVSTCVHYCLLKN